MMNESDFKALNEHLEEARPIFDAFCSRHGFAYVDKTSLGRYPRIRVERPGTVRIWFDLWMEFDKDGHRFEHFDPDNPYELSAGAYIDIDDGSQYGIRYQKAFQCFSDERFDTVVQVLNQQLENFLPELEKWDRQQLMSDGQMTRLGGHKA